MLDAFSYEQRLALIKHVTSLTPPDFGKLVLVLNPPGGVISSSSSPQGNRVIELIEWVNNPNGCKLDVFLEILHEIAPLPDELKPPTPEPQPESEAKPDTDPEAEYLECQRNDCIFNDIEGIKQRNVLLLEEIFVSLELTQSGYGHGPMGTSYEDIQLEDRLQRQTNLQIWDLLAHVQQIPAYSRLVILAQGGYGKTTLLRHITYTFSTGRHEAFRVPKFIPVLLYLRKWRDVIAQNNALDLPTLITQHHIPELPGGKSIAASANWMNALLKDGKVVVLVDGFDEVAEAQRESVSQWLNKQMRDYPKSIFLLTSRPGGYEYYTGQENFKSTVFVQPFEPKQWKDFIQKWYFCHERARRFKSEEYLTTVQDIATKTANQLIDQIEAPERNELASMATNPLLLNMIVELHENNPGGQLPRYRAELYEAICRMQLRDRPQAKKIALPLDRKSSQRVLQQLALKLQETVVTQLSERELLDFLAQVLDKTVTAEEYLEWICQVSELLVERNANEYEFSHRSFQSYLAAVEVGGRNKEAWLLDKWNHEQDWWHETIILYIAQLDNPNQAIQGLVDRRAADLAYKCLQETSKRIEPELLESLEQIANQVQDLRFQQLEEYLKQGQWKEADKETYRLMITTVGKEEGQGFAPEELLNFPCEELLTIDGLWVSYSKGKFGFSVQKEIYLECGGIPDGKYYKDAYKKYYDVVGWIGVKYYISSPKGHLPLMVGWRGERRRWWGCIFSRIQTCKV